MLFLSVPIIKDNPSESDLIAFILFYKNIGVSLNDPRILPVFLTFFELKQKLVSSISFIGDLK